MSEVIWFITTILFCAGLALVIFRRQMLAMLLGIELMIAAVNVSLVHYSQLYGDPQTMVTVIIILSVAAAEAVVGLSLILRLLRRGRGINTDGLMELKG